MKKISVDSIPNPSEMCTDYSSTQVFSVSALTLLKVECEPLPMFTPKSHGVIVTENESLIKVEFISDEYFEDNTRVMGHHYKNRIDFLKENHPLLNFTLLKDLKVKSSKNHLELNFSGRLPLVKNLLGSILLTPKKTGTLNLSAGDYTLEKKDGNTWEARNRIEIEDKIQFITIKDCEDNLNLVKIGFLDQTADTATPDSKIQINNYQLCHRRPSIHGYLIFDGRLVGSDVSLRGEIYYIINNFSEIINYASRWERTLEDFIFDSDYRVKSSTLREFSKNPLRIAYSDFYPNLSIVLILSDILTQSGIKNVLIQEDYYNPGIACDIRLYLTKGLIPGEWGQISSLIFCPVIRSNKNLLKECIFTLRKNDDFKITYKKICGTINPQLPFVYLGEVNSVFYRRLI